jgi:hypothetical protein
MNGSRWQPSEPSSFLDTTHPLRSSPTRSFSSPRWIWVYQPVSLLKDPFRQKNNTCVIIPPTLLPSVIPSLYRFHPLPCPFVDQNWNLTRVRALALYCFSFFLSPCVHRLSFNGTYHFLRTHSFDLRTSRIHLLGNVNRTKLGRDGLIGQSIRIGLSKTG